MNILKPILGQVVHYTSHGSPDGQHTSEKRAAIVTKSNDFGTIALCILNPTGMYFNTHVNYNADGKEGTWNFTPQHLEKEKEIENTIKKLRGETL